MAGILNYSQLLQYVFAGEHESLPLLRSYNLLRSKMNSGGRGCLGRFRLLCFHRFAFGHGFNYSFSPVSS